VRVLFVTQHYAPEVTAAVARVTAFAEGLAARGHEVEVVTALPNHPAGEIAEEYAGMRGVREELNGVNLRRVWLRVRRDKTTVNRVLTYGTFAAAATFAGARARRPDIVLTSSPPLPTAAAAATIARRHRVPWAFDVRDLWPEAAVVLGELRGDRVIRTAERLERGLYRSAAVIIAATEPFRETIAAGGVEWAKLEVIMNGTTQAWLDAGERDPDRKSAGMPEDEFVWAYGGNVGIGQGLEAAIDAAEILGEGYRLLVVGEGPRLEPLRERAVALPHAQVEFRQLQPPEEAARLLRASDALLVPLADRPELSKYVPSKLFDCCALGRPVLVAAAGEPQRLVSEAGAGVAVPPEDPAALADAIRRLRDDPDAAERLSAQARIFAAENLRDRGVERLEELLAGLVPQASGD